MTTKIALSSQSLKIRMEKKVSKVPLDTAVVVGICIGNNKTMEKNNPEQTVDNIAQIYSHIQEMVSTSL